MRSLFGRLVGVAVVVVAAYLVLSKLSKNKSRWVLGAWRPNCPRCGTPLIRGRVSTGTSIRAAMPW